MRWAIVLWVSLVAGFGAEPGWSKRASSGMTWGTATKVALAQGRTTSWWIQSGNLFRTADEGQTFEALTQAPALLEVLDVGSDGMVGLTTSSGLVSSTDGGHHWQTLVTNTSPGLIDPAWAGRAGEVLFVRHRHGLMRVRTSLNTASWSSSLTSLDGWPRLASDGSNHYAIHLSSSASKLEITFSQDSGGSWATPWSVMSLGGSAAILGFEAPRSAELSILIREAGSLKMLESRDGGVLWTSTILSNSLDIAQPTAFSALPGLRRVIYRDVTGTVYAESVDGGRHWARSFLPVTSDLLSAGFFPVSGTAFVVDAVAGLEVQGDIFAMSPLSRGYLRAEHASFAVEFSPHPLGEAYEIKLNRQLKATASSAPVMLEISLQSSDVVEVVARRKAHRASALKLTHLPGSARQSAFVVEKAQGPGSFRMVSFPPGARTLTGGVSARAYIESQLGRDYSASVWRFGRWNAANLGYDTGSDLGSWDSGHSYWMISAFSLATEFEYLAEAQSHALIRLDPGWNMVASPFGEAVDWGGMSAIDGMEVWSAAELAVQSIPVMGTTLWEWDQGAYKTATTLLPFRGYWVKNLVSRKLLLSLSRETVSPRAKAPPKGKEGKEPPAPPVFEAASTPTSAGSGGGGCFIALNSSRLQ